MTITTAQLDTIAPSLWQPAREAAHSDVAPCDAPTFAAAYVRAVARLCGGIAADQCAAGEAWAPVDWLPADHGAVTEAAEALGVELDAAAWRELWALYCEGDTRVAEAYGAC